MLPRKEQFRIALEQLNEVYSDVPVPERMLVMRQTANDISY